MRLVGDELGTVDSVGSGVVVAQPRAGVWNGFVVGIARDLSERSSWRDEPTGSLSWERRMSLVSCSGMGDLVSCDADGMGIGRGTGVGVRLVRRLADREIG